MKHISVFLHPKKLEHLKWRAELLGLLRHCLEMFEQTKNEAWKKAAFEMGAMSREVAEWLKQDYSKRI